MSEANVCIPLSNNVITKKALPTIAKVVIKGINTAGALALNTILHNYQLSYNIVKYGIACILFCTGIYNILGEEKGILDFVKGIFQISLGVMWLNYS